MLAAAAAMALHEGGHVLAMALCGVRECRIELTPFGGVADVPGFERLPARRQCLIALAGVPVSAACAGLCLRFAPPAEFFRLFYRFSLGMALVNVLPVWPLDFNPFTGETTYSEYGYDLLLSAGDYSDSSQCGPTFKIEDVRSRDIGGDAISKTLPDFISTGSNVHIQATVGRYDSEHGIFYLNYKNIVAR